MIKQLVGSATALAIVIGAAASAEARPRWGGWGGHYGGHFRHHHGGDAFGNILLGAVIGGGLFAIANSANRNKAVPSRRGEDQRDDLRDSGTDAREVASMCSDAVENMARGRVASIDSVDRDGGGWRVDGVIDVEREGDRHFFCDVVDGRIENVQLSNREGERRGTREPYRRTYPG
jgi:hypothetical protein